MRRAAIAAAALALSCPATAAPRRGKAEAPGPCEKLYRSALKLEHAGRLEAAQERLHACAVPRCGVFLQHQCTLRFGQIESDLSTIVPVVTDRAGDPVVDVALRVDGEVVVEHLDGHAVAIGPGQHELSFERDGAEVAHRSVVILQGQRNRPMAVKLGRPTAARDAVGLRAGRSRSDGDGDESPPVAEDFAADDLVEGAHGEVAHGKARPAAPARVEAEDHAAPVGDRAAADQGDHAGSDGDAATAASPPKRRRRHDASAALLPAPAPTTRRVERGGSGLGTYLLLTAGVAGIGGYGVFTYWGRKDNRQLAQCSPDCPQASVDHIRALYLGADISLGVGAAALLGGSLLAWHYHSSYSVEVAPDRSGAVASLSGAF